MELNNDIRIAIAKYIEDSGSQANAADRMGISSQNLSRYLNGSVKTIKAAQWKIIREAIKKYITVPIIEPLVSDSTASDYQHNVNSIKLLHEIDRLKLEQEIQSLKHEVEVLKLREELRDMRELLRREKESKVGEESGGEEVYANPRQELRREVG